MLSPLFGQLSPLRVPTRVAAAAPDADALAYIAAVEAADGQTLEEGVAAAFTDFIVGCKSDGIWSSLKSSCILAGARTLDGALVPLVGAAPTNNNFVSADYNRETGLKGDGSTKFLNSNRANNADPQNSKHLAVFSTEIVTTAQRNLIGAGVISNNGSIIQLYTTTSYRNRLNSANVVTTVTAANDTGLTAINRNSSSSFTFRHENTNFTVTATSAAGVNLNTFVFAGSISSGASGYNANRISFYSLGENIDLAALDTRVSTLMTQISATL